MRPALPLLALAITSLLAGCLGASGPTNWETLPRLEAHALLQHANGTLEAWLYPMTPVATPTTCAATRGANPESGGTCRVLRRGDEGWSPLAGRPAWALHATWPPERPHALRHPDVDVADGASIPRNAVAYDREERPAAWWQGHLHPTATVASA